MVWVVCIVLIIISGVRQLGRMCWKIICILDSLRYWVVLIYFLLCFIRVVVWMVWVQQVYWVMISVRMILLIFLLSVVISIRVISEVGNDSWRLMICMIIVLVCLLVQVVIRLIVMLINSVMILEVSLIEIEMCSLQRIVEQRFLLVLFEFSYIVYLVKVFELGGKCLLRIFICVRLYGFCGVIYGVSIVRSVIIIKMINVVVVMWFLKNLVQNCWNGVLILMFVGWFVGRVLMVMCFGFEDGFVGLGWNREC